MDNDASIKAVDAAARPIIATLDEVIAHGDANWQMIALYMKGDLLFGLQARLRSTIPPVTPQTPLEAAQAIERRHDALEPKLEHWGAEATATLRQFSALARANPQVVGASPVLQSMAQRTEGLL